MSKPIIPVSVAFLSAILFHSVVSPFQTANASDQTFSSAKTPNKQSDLASAKNNSETKQQQLFWQNFLKLEVAYYHYNYSKTERENVEAYRQFECANIISHGYTDPGQLCNPSTYPRDEMWQREQLRDEVLWNKANHQPHFGIKKTDQQLRYLQSRMDMREEMTLHQKVNDVIWTNYLQVEGQTWHYNYNKTEKQNLEAFHARFGSNKTAGEMWFLEQHGIELIWSKAVSMGSSKPLCTIMKDCIKSWFEEGYQQHVKEVAKNKCVNPWERTPTNAAPKWTACADANASVTASKKITPLPSK